MMNKEDIQQLINDIAEIKKALVGDTKWGNDGLIKDVTSLKKWRQQVTLRVAFYSGAATTVVILVNRAIDLYLTTHK